MTLALEQAGLPAANMAIPERQEGWTFATAPRLRLADALKLDRARMEQDEILMHQQFALTRAAVQVGKALRSSRWNAQRREVDHPFAFRVDAHQRGGLCGKWS